MAQHRAASRGPAPTAVAIHDDADMQSTLHLKSSGIKKDSLLFAHGLDQRFHVVQVAFQRALARRRSTGNPCAACGLRSFWHMRCSPASSNLRAWTLRLPSVVSSSFFSSLKVSDSFTESALRIPRRRRSWIRRSSFGALAHGLPEAGLLLAFAPHCVLIYPPYFTAITVPKINMQPAEPSRQQQIVPTPAAAAPPPRRHETRAHHRHDPHRCRPARNHRRAIEQQPHARQKSARLPGAEQDRRQQPLRPRMAGVKPATNLRPGPESRGICERAAI